MFGKNQPPKLIKNIWKQIDYKKNMEYKTDE